VPKCWALASAMKNSSLSIMAAGHYKAILRIANRQPMFAAL
jgi:hypothetical protein